MALLLYCVGHLLGLSAGKKCCCETVLATTKAFALCGTLVQAMALDPEVTFLQAIRVPIIKGDGVDGDGVAPKNVDYELRQLLSESIIADRVTDIFKVAGLGNQISASYWISSWQKLARFLKRTWRLNFSNGCREKKFKSHGQNPCTDPGYC